MSNKKDKKQEEKAEETKINTAETSDEVNDSETEAPKADEKQDELISKIQELEDKAKEYEILAKRKVADFDNFRKRMQKEKNELSEMISNKVIVDFLPVIDNLERAIFSAEESKDFESLLEGIVSIKHIFDGVLAKYEIQKVESIGEEFNAEKHQALYTVEGDYKTKTVIEEVEKAYVRKDKVLRTAKVAVGLPKVEKKEEALNED